MRANKTQFFFPKEQHFAIAVGESRRKRFGNRERERETQKKTKPKTKRKTVQGRRGPSNRKKAKKIGLLADWQRKRVQWAKLVQSLPSLAEFYWVSFGST